MFFTISQNKKNDFQGYKNKKFKKLKTHGFGSKIAIDPTFFFQTIQARKMSFTIFQNKKTPFQAIKTTSSNSRKIDIFRKGLTHSFGPKMAIFSTFFFKAIQARRMSFTIFQSEKTVFKATKTRSSNSRQIDIFPTFFFWQYRPGKYLLRYSRTKKRLSRL